MQCLNALTHNTKKGGKKMRANDSNNTLLLMYSGTFRITKSRGQ